MALRDRCCVLSFSLIAGLLRRWGSQPAFDVLVQHPRQQARRLLPHLPRQLFPARPSRAPLKQGKLGGPARARWDSHQHLLRVTRNRAGLVACDQDWPVTSSHAEPSARATHRCSPRALAPPASDSTRWCRTSIAEPRRLDSRAAAPIRTGPPSVRDSPASHRSRRRGRTTGATDKELLGIRYYGCSIDDLYNNERPDESLSMKMSA